MYVHQTVLNDWFTQKCNFKSADLKRPLGSIDIMGKHGWDTYNSWLGYVIK